MARDLESWTQEQAERELLCFLRENGDGSHSLRILRDGPRWLVAKGRLSEPLSIGEGENFGQAWFEASGSGTATLGEAAEARRSPKPGWR